MKKVATCRMHQITQQYREGTAPTRLGRLLDVDPLNWFLQGRGILQQVSRWRSVLKQAQSLTLCPMQADYQGQDVELLRIWCRKQGVEKWMKQDSALTVTWQ